MKMMAVPVTLGSNFNAGNPRILFEGCFGSTALIREYDVAKDGRFLMTQAKERPRTTVSQMIHVQNCLEELKHKAPAKFRPDRLSLRGRPTAAGATAGSTVRAPRARM